MHCDKQYPTVGWLHHDGLGYVSICVMVGRKWFVFLEKGLVIFFWIPNMSGGDHNPYTCHIPCFDHDTYGCGSIITYIIYITITIICIWMDIHLS